MPQKIVLQGSLPNKFILLGEDDEDDREMLKEVFASIDNSFVLFFVNTGKEMLSALEKLPEDKLPCLIILDYNMPELNGADILKELKTNDSYLSIPKVIWSTSGSEKFKKTCLELGAADYLIKPSSHEDLVKIAEYMLSICKN